MAKPTAPELIAKIEEAHGNISAVARAYHRSRKTVYDWINSYPTVRQALRDQRETVVDAAESVLFKRAIQDQELSALFYILNNMTEAKERGWSPRTEHTGAGGNEIIFRVIYGDDGTSNQAS
jgi:transposase-like protein